MNLMRPLLSDISCTKLNSSDIVCCMSWAGIKLSFPNIFFTVTKVFRKILVTLSQL